MSPKEFNDLVKRIENRIDPTDSSDKIECAIEPIVADYEEPMDLVMVGVALAQVWNGPEEEEEDDDPDLDDETWDE